MLTRRLALVLLACAAGSAACSGRLSNVWSPDDAATFIVTLGNDTVSAESYTRQGNRVDGVILRRTPRAVVMRYTIDLAPNGLASRLEYNVRLADGTSLPNAASTVVVTFTGDSAITQIVRDSTTTRRIAASNAFPELAGGIFFFSLPITAVRATDEDSAMFNLYSPGAAQATKTPVVRKASNRWWVYSFGNPNEFVTDDEGRIVSGHGDRTTFRFQTRRQPHMDLTAMAAAFLQRERERGPIVALSPRDSVAVTIAGTRISVDYGRPSTRGRRIWGPNGVLGDTLWRTGANASTKFTTTDALTIGGKVLPAGTYSLMTLAVPDRYALLFLREDREVLRVPLSMRPLASRVEQFTILLDQTTERAGVLRLRWDTQELHVPFTIGG